MLPIPHPLLGHFFVPIFMLAIQCRPYLAEYLREGATALLSSSATMGSFLNPLRPPSLCFPLRACGQAFLSTHSIRPLSFTVIHYCRRRSMSCAAVRCRTNANISGTDVILYMKKYDRAFCNAHIMNKWFLGCLIYSWHVTGNSFGADYWHCWTRSRTDMFVITTLTDTRHLKSAWFIREIFQQVDRLTLQVDSGSLCLGFCCFRVKSVCFRSLKFLAAG